MTKPENPNLAKVREMLARSRAVTMPRGLTVPPSLTRDPVVQILVDTGDEAEKLLANSPTMSAEQEADIYDAVAERDRVFEIERAQALIGSLPQDSIWFLAGPGSIEADRAMLPQPPKDRMWELVRAEAYSREDERPFAPVEPEQASEPTKPAGLNIVSASSFAGLEKPSREFVDSLGLIPMHNVTLLAGDGGTGKSLLAMQLALGVATHSRWLNLYVRTGPCLYYSAEDDQAETHIRLSEIAEADGIDLATADSLRIILLAGEDAVLANDDPKTGLLKWTGLFAQLQSAIRDERPILVIIDNLADVFAGNENVRPSARQFIGKLRGLAIEFACAIVVLSHPSLSGMASGSGTSGNTAWSNSARSRLYLRREIGDDKTEVDANRRTLQTMKANYGPIGGSLTLEWTDGRFISVDGPAGGLGPLDAAAKRNRAERIFLEMVVRFTAQNRPISPAKSPTYAPALFADHPMSEGVKAREFLVAMNSLLERGRIEIIETGPPSKRRPHIRIRQEAKE